MDQTVEKSTPALQEVLACRVCLATTGKMFCIETCGLQHAFFDISGFQVSLGDGLPQHICYICCALLHKAVEFRNKCHSTQSLLSSLPLTLDLMHQINMLHGRQLIRTNVVYVNVGEEIKIEDIKLEDDSNNAENALYDKGNVMNENKLDHDLTEFFSCNVKVEDLRIENDLNDCEDVTDNNSTPIETGLNDCKESTDNNLSPMLDQQSDFKCKSKDAKNKKKQKQSVLKDIMKNIDTKGKKNTTPKRITNKDIDDKLKTQNILNSPHFDMHKIMIHKYIEGKYVNKTCNEESIKDADEPPIVATESNITFNLDPKVNKFYDYLRDRYEYIDADRDAAVKKALDSTVGNKTDTAEYEPKYNQIYAAKKAKEFGNKYNFNVVTFSREEQIKNMRERMETDRYKNAKYKCEDCYTGFQYEDAYNKHRTKHDPVLSGSSECESCKYRFQSRADLFSHIRSSHKYRYICKECDKYFNSRGSPLQIIGDIVIEHDNNQIEVDDENHTVDHVQKPRQIIGVRLNKAPKTSAERGREFRARKALLKQQSKLQQEPDEIVEIATEDIRSAGPSEDNKVPGPSEIRTIEKRAKSAEATRRWREKKKGVSESPKKQAKTAAQRMRQYRERKKILHALEHYQKHNGGGATFQCKHCPAVFRKRCRYFDHKRDKHGTAACDICHAVLTSAGVAQHMKLQHKETFKCQTCGKVFNDSAARDKHAQTAPNGVCNANDWACTKCGDHFSSKDRLEQHIISSRKPLPKKRKKAISVQREGKQRKINKDESGKCSDALVCELCGRTYASAVLLRQHLLIHSEEKPFKCPMCAKGFNVKHILKIHIRTHTGEKPHTCPECPAAFAAYTNLRRHKITVHQQLRAYPCDICHKAFHQKSGLTMHVRTVHMKIPLPPRVRNRKKKIVDFRE